MTTPLLIDDIKRDEGCRLHAYQDTVGVWTIGYGHAHVNPTTVWTQDLADSALKADIAIAIHTLDSRLPWWRGLDDVRQDVLAELCFNMGFETLLGFKNTLAHIQAGEYGAASRGMLASKWASQVGARAERLAHMMKTGSRA